MQLQNFSPDKSQEQILKKIEAREASPAQLAREMLRQGDVRVTELKSQIDDLIGELGWDPSQEQTILQLEMIQNELDRAHSELRDDLRQTSAENELPSEEGWDIHGSETATENDSDMFESAEAFKEAMENLLTGPNFDFAAFNRLKHQVANFEGATEDLTDSLEVLVGKKYARRLMEEPGYAERLEAMANSLSGRLGEDGPEIMSERTIANLIAVQEMFGDNPMALVNALNLQKYESSLVMNAEHSIIQIQGIAIDLETGDLSESSIDVGMSGMYTYEAIDEETGEKRTDTDTAEVFRRFSQTTETRPDGTVRKKKKVKHELLKFPEAIQGSGIAAKVTRESLPCYDAAGLDEITLEASLDRGGYAWAAYGYGWDQNEMGIRQYQEQQAETAVASFDEAGFKAELAASEPELKPAEIQKRIRSIKESLANSAKSRAAKDFQAFDGPRRAELTMERVKTIVKKCLSHFEEIAIEANLPAAIREQFRKIYQEFIDNPETATPNNLAKVGKNGPFFRQGESGVWRTEEDFQEAVRKGEDKELKQMPKPMHIGKITLSGTTWHGKIELKPTGKQQGANRKILESVINR